MIDIDAAFHRAPERPDSRDPGREREASSLKGILPISQSRFYGKASFDVEIGVDVEKADFPLVGSGEAYANCGSFFSVGCLNVEEHKGSNLDGVVMEGKAYIERRKVSCHRPLCPTCWEDWANREKDKATVRLRSFVLKGRNLKPIHLTVSIPHSDYALSLQKMREKTYAALKRVHCIGGMTIYHPKRKDAAGEWFYSPHFHILGYGWIVDVRQNYVYSGYIVKNIGIRKTVEGTIYYQLSHCGVAEKKHTITWFGALAYNKLNVESIEKEESVCPLCGRKLKQLLWIGEGLCTLPEVEGGSYFDDPFNWMEKPRRMWFEDG